MTASPSRCYSGHHKVTEEDQGILGKEIWRKKCRQQDTSTAGEQDGGGNTRQSWVETNGLWPMFHRERQGISQLSRNKERRRLFQSW